MLAGPLADSVRAVAAKTDGDLIVLGSGALVQQLHAAGLVDRWEIMLHPVVVGSGSRMFGPQADATHLRLTRCRSTEQGLVLLTYSAPTRTAVPEHAGSRPWATPARRPRLGSSRPCATAHSRSSGRSSSPIAASYECTATGSSAPSTKPYRIATNTCLQLLRRIPRPIPPMPTDGRPPVYSSMPWLQPIPDTVLDQAAPTEQQPDARAVAKETVTLAFLAVIRLLPPRQRAVLLLRDVLAFTAAEIAAILDSSPASVNSALQRAHTTLAQFQTDQQSRTQPADAAEKTLLDRYITAHETLDPQAIIAVLRGDARLTISPTGLAWDGRDEITEPYLEGMGALGEWRCLAIRANRQPAVAPYLRRWGSEQYEAFTVVVLDVRADQLTELATFAEPSLFAAFGLPPVLV